MDYEMYGDAQMKRDRLNSKKNLRWSRAQKKFRASFGYRFNLTLFAYVSLPFVVVIRKCSREASNAASAAAAVAAGAFIIHPIFV